MSDHLITTPAVLAACEGCGSHILACRTSGFRVYADPAPLSIAEEITVRLDDRDLYDVITLGLPLRIYLEYRDLTRVICGRNHPVVAAHECPSGRRLAMTAAAGTGLAYPFTRPEKKKGKVPHGRPDEIPF
jgi:hypothetical protein